MIRYLQLPFHFDATRLQQEVAAITGKWIAHFNQHDYEGGWSGIPLRSLGGSVDDLFPTERDKVQFEDTLFLKQSPYLQEVLKAFECEVTNARLLKLEKGAIIKEHTDAGLNYESGEARMHIAVVTHPDLEFYLDGERLDFKEGDCWYINASLPHRVSNLSPVDRIHLVFDCNVNEWLQAQFESDKVISKSIKDTSAQERELKLKVIQELRQSKDENMIRLAEQMEGELRTATP